MDGKQDEIFGFDYPELDLSDDGEDDSKKQPTGEPSKKVKVDSSIQPNNQTQSKSIPTLNVPINQMPFIPPPPPGPAPQFANVKPHFPSQPPKKTYQNSNSTYQNNRHGTNKNFNNNNSYGNSSSYVTNKEKKSTVYVKNIPKNFNTAEKLMTFFKNEGIIKQIKVNESDQSATVKFQKQEHAYKFLKSGKSIFNRSYIVYSEKQYMTINPQQIKDRQKDQLGVVKKAEQTNMKMQRIKWSQNIAQKLRALYFFQKWLIAGDDTESQRKQIEKDIKQSIEIKSILQDQDKNESLIDLKQSTLRQYSWTLIFRRTTSFILQKKHLFPQYLKIGPIVMINLRRIFLDQPVKKEGQKGSEQTQIYEYEISLMFLGPKTAWEFYSARNDKQIIYVEGQKAEDLFRSNKLVKLFSMGRNLPSQDKQQPALQCSHKKKSKQGLKSSRTSQLNYKRLKSHCLKQNWMMMPPKQKAKQFRNDRSLSDNEQNYLGIFCIYRFFKMLKYSNKLDKDD